MHGVLMVIASLLLASLDYTLEPDTAIAKWLNTLKRTTFLSKLYSDTANLDAYLFVDVSGALALIPKTDGLGNQVITDRAALANFFELCRRYDNYQFILGDISFIDPSQHDSLLHAVLHHTPRIVFNCAWQDGRYLPPLFDDLPMADASYLESSGYNLQDGFVKYRLTLDDTLENIALVVHRRLHASRVVVRGGIVWIGDQAYRNTNMLDFRVSTRTVNNNDNSRIIPLPDLLFIQDDSVYMKATLKDKVIVIGDFIHDTHNTIMGQQPGSLILVNILEALKYGDGVLGVAEILYMLICYVLISFAIFHRKVRARLSRWRENVRNKIGKFLVDILGYPLVMLAVVVVGYFGLNIHIDAFILTTYLTIVYNATENFVFAKKHPEWYRRFTRFMNI